MSLIGFGLTPVASAQPQLGRFSPAWHTFSFSSDLPLSPLSQQNAVNAAEDYLALSAFSRQGLIKQLEYEGYSTVDATYAVDHITVDWNQQAVRSAKDYLNMSSFSRSGLIQQLEFEGFTPSQAAYGVAGTGL